MHAVLQTFCGRLAEKIAEAVVNEVVARREQAAKESRERWEKTIAEAREIEAAGGTWPARRQR